MKSKCFFVLNLINFLGNRLNQQVETVGDKYLAVSGLPDECEKHALCIARIALDMIEMADNVKMGNQPIVSSTFSIISLRFSTLVLLLLFFRHIVSPPRESR